MRHFIFFSVFLVVISCSESNKSDQNHENNETLTVNNLDQSSDESEQINPDLKLDFSSYQLPFKLIANPSGGSCYTYELQDANKEKVKLNEELITAFDCPSMLDLHEGSLLTYQVKNDIFLLDLKDGLKRKIITLYEGVDGISNPAWNSAEQLLFVVVNQEKVGNYETNTRLLFVDLAEAGLKKRKFDRLVNFSCGSICSAQPGLDFGFLGESTLWYKRHEMIGEGSIRLISLDDEEYVDHEQIHTLISCAFNKDAITFCKLIDEQQKLWEKEIDLAVGGDRIDNLLHMERTDEYCLYVYHTRAEHGRGGEDGYFYTLTDYQGNILRSNDFIGFGADSISVELTSTNLIFKIYKKDANQEIVTIPLPE